MTEDAGEELLRGLNPAQRKAVVAPDQPVLVLAGAGSGKTRVLTHRIAYLLAQRRASADRVIAVTFTNKAAREMRTRITSLLGAEPHGMWLGTFHACSARILRDRGELIGIPRNFVIYDEVDRSALIKEAIRQAGLDEKRLSPATAGGEISRAKNDLKDARSFAEGAVGYVESQVALVYPRYQALLEAAGALDFDDLLFRVVELLQQSEEVRARYRRRFDHVLVDEYQDTNRAQYLLLRDLVEEHRHITVVGDPDQSVYSWRGADIRNILEFQHDYPDALVIPLEQNYRSTKAILAAAQSVIRENSGRVEKGLWTEGPDGMAVVVAQLYDEREEATAVAREARRLVDEGECHFGDMAILYRTNAQSRALEETLLRAGLPYRLVGGVRFYQRREVKDVLAYLRLLILPKDRLAFERVVNVPKRGVGVQSLSELMRTAAERGVSHWELIGDPQAAGVRGAAANGLRRFREMIDEVAEWGAPWPLVTVLDKLLERSGYRQFVRDGSIEGEERWANVVELRGLAAEQGDLPSAAALPVFLEQVALAGEVDQMDESTSALTLITLHQVKGLEFPVVFITGVEEGLLPHSRSLDTLSEIEEERRLLYVGMTRAKRRLYLSHCFRRHVYGSPASAIPSRFLAALGDRAEVERWEVGAAPTWNREDQPGRQNSRYVAPVAARGQPLPLRRARDAVFDHATAPGLKPPAESRFQAGDRVEHARFGRGVIRASELTGAGEEVVIDFESSGHRRFAVSDAVLRRVEG
ncbi:MAG TPA: UvrD-helicase domain-containing protein [Candidatus Acidoferrales bacterium]|nr:UvrD-helicase domain-containing protein [Candidatus Acidoferrales bacterium]